MSTVEEIEKAVLGLEPSELAQFRAWFDAYDAEVWDKQIEADAAAGKLDALASKALEDFRAGRCTEL